MMKLIVSIAILAAACCNQIVLSCRTTDDRQINLLQLEINYLSQEVEALKNQSKESQQKEQIYSLSQQVDTLKNQSKENRQLFLDIFSKGLHVPPNFYIYQLTPNSQSWNKSRQYCQNWGGDLAVYGVKTRENRRKLSKILSINGLIWIGAHDIASEGNWIWVNGERASRSELIWFSGQPDNYDGNEDCLYLHAYSGTSNDGLAFDRPCWNSFRGLCEKKI